MQILGVSAREDAVDLVILDARLELGAQLGAERQALLLAGEVHDVLTLIHLCSSTGGKLEHLVLATGPGDGVLLLGFGGVEQTARAADGLGEVDRSAPLLSWLLGMVSRRTHQ